MFAKTIKMAALLVAAVWMTSASAQQVQAQHYHHGGHYHRPAVVYHGSSCNQAYRSYGSGISIGYSTGRPINGFYNSGFGYPGYVTPVYNSRPYYGNGIYYGGGYGSGFGSPRYYGNGGGITIGFRF